MSPFRVIRRRRAANPSEGSDDFTIGGCFSCPLDPPIKSADDEGRGKRIRRSSRRMTRGGKDLLVEPADDEGREGSAGRAGG